MANSTAQDSHNVDSLVRDYARHIAAQDGAPDDLSQALVTKGIEDDQRARQLSTLTIDWQGLFKPQIGPGLIENRDVQILDRTSRELAIEWRKFQSRLPKGHRSKLDDAPPRLQDVLSAVESATNRQAQEKTSKTGVVKDAFNTTCSALDTHSNLFAIIPSGDKYLCLLAGSLSSIVTASVMHEKLAGEVESAIDELCDSVKLWARQANIHPHDKHMAPFVARLYNVVFTFLLEIMVEWLGSRRKRFFHSFGSGLQSRLQASRASIADISTILEKHGNLSTREHIMQLGTMAETRAMWDREIRAPILREMKAVVGSLAEKQIQLAIMAQQDSLNRKQGLISTASVSPTPTIQQIGPGIMRGAKSDHEKPNGQAKRHEKSKVLAWSSNLEAYRQGAVVDDMTQTDWNSSVGLELFSRLEAWYQTNESGTLWIIGQYQDQLPSHTNLIAISMFNVLRKAKISCLAYFCNTGAAEQMSMDMSERLKVMLYSLVAQAVALLPETFSSSADFSKARFASLTNKDGSSEDAVDLLADLLAVGPGALFCILDGIDPLANHGENRPSIAKLLALLHSEIKREQSEDSVIRKTLFSTDGFCEMLRVVSVEERFDVVDFDEQATGGGEDLNLL